MTTTSPQTARVRLVCRAAALMLGDRVLTPSRRWETVTGLHRGETYSRSVRVVTDATGPDYPWIWIDQHPLVTLRPSSTLATRMGVAA